MGGFFLVLRYKLMVGIGETRREEVRSEEARGKEAKGDNA